VHIDNNQQTAAAKRSDRDGGKIQSASFRDPAGRLLSLDGRVIRIVNRVGLPDITACLASMAVKKFQGEDRLAAAKILGSSETAELLKNEELLHLYKKADGVMLIEHEKVPFISFPYEWPPEMLYETAQLTLDLAASLLEEGLGLKDATPYNTLFHGCKPVFVDLLSIERRDPGNPTWLPYTQFVRTFLLPLLVNKYFAIPLDQILATRRDGVNPEEVYPLCGRIRKFMPPFLTLVTIPAWLNARHNQDNLAIYQKNYSGNFEKVRFILKSQFNGLRRTLQRLQPGDGRNSPWSDYAVSNNNYSREQIAGKRVFVEEAIMEFGPKKVLDIGCNNGQFGFIAAGRGASVIAIDNDPVVVGAAYRTARAEGFDFLPLVIDITRPTPAVGWKNQECASFLARARGAFDMVMMLAVIHHMLVTERIPLSDIVDLAAELTTDLLLIEFIAPDDSNFRRIARGNESLFHYLTPAFFETAWRKRFSITRSLPLANSSRKIYLLRKKR